jgi:transcriptional regulator with XRE-family HTH domain
MIGDYIMREESAVVSFLKRLMRRRKRLPSQLATEIGVSHTTVIRWLSGKDVPCTGSCRRLAEYSGVSLQRILASAGHLPEMNEEGSSDWPEFREYARKKYPDELDEDLVTMIEDLIERRRQRKGEKKNSRVGI